MTVLIHQLILTPHGRLGCEALSAPDPKAATGTMAEGLEIARLTEAFAQSSAQGLLNLAALRGVDVQDLITSASATATASLTDAPVDTEIAAADLNALFGVELESRGSKSPPPPPGESPSKSNRLEKSAAKSPKSGNPGKSKTARPKAVAKSPSAAKAASAKLRPTPLKRKRP